MSTKEKVKLRSISTELRALWYRPKKRSPGSIPESIASHLRKALPQPWRDTSRVLCPVLRSPGQETYGLAGAKSSKRHQHIQGLEHMMDKERPRKLVLCTPEKRRFRGNVTTIDNYMVKEQGEGEGMFLTEHGNRMRGKTQRLKPGQFWLNKREKKYCECGKTPEHIAQRGGGIYLFRDAQDWARHSTEELDLLRPILRRQLDQISPEVSSSWNYSKFLQ